MTNKNQTSDIVYWKDGTPLTNRKHIIFLDTDINLVPKSNKGTLKDGREVENINGKWFVVEK